jgi:putative redox protein
MLDRVTIGLKNNMSFDVEVNGHKMKIDAAKEFGGNDEGPRPKSLMLVALAGCTGMDIASLLRKMRIEFEDLRISVDGNITDTHPKHFDSMHIKYIIRGNNIPVDKVNSAIDKKAMKITHELIIEE